MIEKKATVGFPGKTKQITVQAPDNSPDIWGVDTPFRVVGTDVRRLDGVAKVTGKAKFTYDVKLPGMLYGHIVRSAHPAAIVKAINVDAARAMPGVKAIVTAFEEAQIGEKQMRFAGEEILAIAAETPQQAEDAARAVKIEYEAIPFVIDMEDARKADAPKVHKDSGNVTKGRSRGDAAKAAEALATAHKVIEATYKTQVQTHNALETHGLTVAPDGENLNVWASTQAVFSVREGLAKNLEIPEDKIRVRAEYIGGGFGAKFGPRPEGILAARLARETNRPVRMMLSRKEEQIATGNRPNSVQHVKIGADKDGKLVGIAVSTYGTGGTGGGAGCAIPVIYHDALPKEAVFKDEEDVFTNAGPACAFRAPGHPQGVFAMEQAMDELATAMEMDPLEFRRKNDADPIRLKEYEIGAKEIGWDRRNKIAGQGPVTNGKRRGIGMGSTRWGVAGNKGPHADVEIHRNGDVVMKQGAQDIGTGFRTAMAIIVAEELGLQPAQIKTFVGDTSLGYGPGSGGSTTTPSVAPAVHAAAFAAKRQLQDAVAKHLGVKPEDVKFADGKVSAAVDVAAGAAAGKTLTFKQACALLPGDKITGAGDREANYEGFSNNVAGVQFAEVEVDEETGQVRVMKVVAVQDAGRTLNKLAMESQICGGVIQGVSYALFENRIMDKQVGHMVNPNLMEYKIAGPADCPEIVPIVFQVANGKNTVGAMGMGEPPIIPTAAAIANATYNAIGVRVRELPMTPDRVIAALQTKGTTAIA